MWWLEGDQQWEVLYGREALGGEGRSSEKTHDRKGLHGKEGP